MNRQGRILIVENEERWQNTLASLLQREGFKVDVASTSGQALEQFDKSFYHFAIFDIRLDDDDDPTDVEGFNLLKELENRKLYEIMPVSMLSAFGTREQMRKAFSQYKVADFIDKSEFDSLEFIQDVHKIFAEKVLINLNLIIHWPSSNNAEQQIDSLKFQGTRVKNNPELKALLTGELEDLLCRLFYEADSIVVESMSLGHSGTSVLRVTPYYRDGAGQQVVVKFGERSLIETEYNNFLNYVQNFISGSRSTNVVTRRSTPHLGGIVYSLLGSASHQLESFGSFYQHSDTHQVEQTLNHLFLNTCGQWYANLGKIQPHNLTSEYTQLLGLTAENLEQALHNLKSAQGKEKLKFTSLPNIPNFTNPVWAIASHAFIKPTYTCITHGDLNENNFLIDEAGHTWLIDFGRTGTGHILRDVAELDAIVRIQLLAENEATLEERLMMETTLCQAANFSELQQLSNNLQTTNKALSKAYAVAIYLRNIAHKLVERRLGDDMSDYYVALIYYALGYLRYYALSRLQREHALLSASLLVDCLGLGRRNE